MYSRIMEESNNLMNEERIQKEAPQLVAALREMKEGLDKVTAKVQDLTAKVKANKFPTAEGVSYLEAKHLLLLSYCQSLVYYLLRKAEGLPINGHPVVRSLIEIRLFLEKIRPIDKKMQYQIQKLTRVSGTATEGGDLKAKDSGVQEKPEDLLKYRPNPDMLAHKIDASAEAGTGVYRPPKFAPALMDEEKMSKQEKNALRKEKETLRGARQSAFVRELMNDMEGKPEEYREEIGTESRELTRYRSKMERRAEQEEELFTRAPLTKMEKKKGKHLLKSRNGLLGLSDGFYDEIKSLPMDENDREQSKGFSSGGGMRKQKKFKRKH